MFGRRRPRFARVKEIGAIQLTERDTLILREVYRHRFLRSTHLAALLAGSSQQLRRRLHLLFHHGYLDRPRCQIDYYHRGGSQPLAYGIGKRGIAFLKARHLAFHPTSGNIQSNGVTRLFLEHALHTSDVLIALEIACRKRSDVRFVSGEELLATSTTLHPAFRWNVYLSASTKIGVVPDAAFALESGNNRICYFLEADRGTMPIERRTLTKSSLVRKLIAYHSTWKRGLLRSKYGWNRFRVLTITTSVERVRHLTEACRKLPSGQGLFLFHDLDSLKSADSLLSLPFRTGHSTQSCTFLF